MIKLFKIMGAMYGVLALVSTIAYGVCDYSWWKPIGTEYSREMVLVLMHVFGIISFIASIIVSVSSDFLRKQRGR